MKSLFSAVSLVAAICLILIVAAIGPARTSEWLEQHLLSRFSATALVGGMNEGVRDIAGKAPGPSFAAVDTQEVRESCDRILALGPRVTGYPGERATYELVRSEFEKIGLEGITSEPFDVTVPIDRGASLTVAATGEVVPLFCVWPNHVQTPTTPSDGLQGRLIYGGDGGVSNLDGKEIGGSIVLVDFDCGQRYINAMSLGAQAVVFFDNGKVTRSEAAQKFLDVPADVPRFWADGGSAQRLLSLAASSDTVVTVKARMTWERVEARNIYGVLPGRSGDGKGRLTVVEAYYDAMSVVPGLSAGAENSAGIVALLQAARAIKTRGDNVHPILFLATSGHFQGLAGVNDFLHRHSRTSGHFRDRTPDNEKIDFKLFIGLDLSSHSSSVASFFTGTFYNSGWGTNDYQKNLLAPYAKKFAEYTSRLWPGEDGRYVDAVAPSKRTWKNYMPVPLALDAEAVLFIGREGLTLASPNDAREFVDTPLDSMQHLDIVRLTAQVNTVSGILSEASADRDLFVPTRLELQDQGHSLAGDVRWFERDKNFAIPQSPVPGAIVTYQQPGPNSVAGVRTLIVTKTDEQGRFRFDIMRNVASNHIHSFEIDDQGRIASAPDLGGWTLDDFPVEQAYGWWENRMMQVLFRCRATTLFEIVDPAYLSAVDVISVMGEDNATPGEFGRYVVGAQGVKEGLVTPAAVVFAVPGTRIKVLMSTSLFGIKYLLTNAPNELITNPVVPGKIDLYAMERAEGTGYPIDQGRILYPFYQTAKDLWAIDDARIKQLSAFGVKNEKLTNLHDRAKTALDDARAALQALDYTRFVAKGREAWGLEARGYPDVKETANDTVRGIIFYFILLLPFSVFSERLIFGFVDVYHRIAGFAGIFVTVFILLHFVHPAFKLSSSPYIIFLAFVILAMGSAVLVMVLTKFSGEVRKVKQSSSGVYEADVGRISATGAAVSLGVSNLRKRRTRTALTAVTLTLLTFTVLSFTSVKTAMTFYKISKDNRPPYEGGLVRDRAWKGLQPSVLDYLTSAFNESAYVVPRAWYLSQLQGERAYIDFRASGTDKTSTASALIGVTADEHHISSMDGLLLGGRWFRAGERSACILPDDLAALVGLTAGDAGRSSIEMMGKRLDVVGIIDSKAFNTLRDMDDEKLTPVDTVNESSRLAQSTAQDPRLVAASPIETFTHLESSNVIILPYEDVLDAGGATRSVAITPRDKSTDFIPQIEDFMSRVALTMFVGHNDKVVVYSSIGSTSISGVGNLLIPILIAALIVMNTMMGSVYERFKEIGIYSSVGLAPTHIGALFLAEAAVYATVGAVIGYLIGQVISIFAVKYGVFSGICLNYSSLSAVWSTLIVMATVFLSTLYPAKKAADMAVPDVTRKWVFPSPEGDHWFFDFPFTVGGADVVGMYAYLVKTFESYGQGSVGDFATESVGMTSRTDETTCEPIYAIGMTVWLAPYDLGISQTVMLEAAPTGDHNIYKIAVTVRRLSGDVSSWRRLNRRFLNVLRKRFLVWRTIPPAVKEAYYEDGEKMAARGNSARALCCDQ